jgi:hypothetical protein
MDAYIYDADIYCEGCADEIKQRLDAPESPDDESTYDSGDYPKGPYANGGGESDYPQVCGGCGEALDNPVIVSDDPDRVQIMHALEQWAFYDETEEFDREEAIYWYAANYHGGQWSNLYSVLSTSEYRPGPLTNGPEPESMSADLYEHLEGYFKDAH